MADRPSGAECSLFVDRAGDWRLFADSGCTEWPTAGQHHGTRLDERGIAQNAIEISLNLQREPVGCPAFGDPGIETTWASVVPRRPIRTQPVVSPSL
jgi:hypothetical protein